MHKANDNLHFNNVKQINMKFNTVITHRTEQHQSQKFSSKIFFFQKPVIIGCKASYSAEKKHQF